MKQKSGQPQIKTYQLTFQEKLLQHKTNKKEEENNSPYTWGSFSQTNVSCMRKK